MNKLAAQLRQQDKSVKILADLTGLGKSSAGSRKASVEALKSMDYNKIALYGANLFMKHLANFIITASGQGSKVRLFAQRSEAKKWLMEN